MLISALFNVFFLLLLLLVQLLIEDEPLSRKPKHYMFHNSQTMGKIDNISEKKSFVRNEIFEIIRATLLAMSVLALCYYTSVEYKVYSILENGQIVQGFGSRQAVTSFSLGYSIPHSIMFAVAIGMLFYSVILVSDIFFTESYFAHVFNIITKYNFILLLQKRPHFSLPLLSLFLTELVCDSCNAVVTIWYLFEYLQLQTALFYTTGFLLLICKSLSSILYFFANTSRSLRR